MLHYVEDIGPYDIDYYTVSTGCSTIAQPDGHIEASSLCQPVKRYDAYLRPNSPDNFLMYHSSCSGDRYTSYGGSACPLGWGTSRSYYAYEPGCYRGSHYPSPIPAHSGPRNSVGSRLSKN